MMDISIPGLAWLVCGLGTAVIAALGALVQLLLLALRAPSGQRQARVIAAVAGPLVALAIALVGGLSVDQFDARTKATLDTGWIFLPLAAFAAWFALNRWLIRALPPGPAS